MGRSKHLRRLSSGLLFVLFVVLFSAGCGESGSTSITAGVTDPEDPVSEPEVVEDSMPEATVGVSPEAVTHEVGFRTGVSGFVADTAADGGEGYGADGVLAVRHGVHDGYERVVVDFGAGSEPAGKVPEWSLITPRGDGLLRLSLPSVISTAVSDGDLGDGFLEDFHVVRAPDGGLFIDVLSEEAFTYRVMELEDPARLAIDFKSAGVPPEAKPPAEGGNTVLTEPRAGERISDPLTVSGYSRNFEARNEIILRDATGEVVARRSVASNDWSATWGYFEATLDLPDFEGRGTLMVGSRSARDGSFEGVEIPVYGTG